DRLDLAPVLQRVLLGPQKLAADPGVVHQDAEPAHILDRRADDADPVVLARDVVLIGEGRAGVVGVDRLGQGADAVQVQIAERDPGALADQHPGHGLAQPPAGAGDQGRLARDAPARHSTRPLTAASMKRAIATSRSVTPSASWVVNNTSTRL